MITKGKLEGAIRRALNIFDCWNDVAGLIVKDTGYYYELQSLMEDAVHCGVQAASGVYKKLKVEKE